MCEQRRLHGSTRPGDRQRNSDRAKRNRRRGGSRRGNHGGPHGDDCANRHKHQPEQQRNWDLGRAGVGGDQGAVDPYDDDVGDGSGGSVYGFLLKKDLFPSFLLLFLLFFFFGVWLATFGGIGVWERLLAPDLDDCGQQRWAAEFDFIPLKTVLCSRTLCWCVDTLNRRVGILEADTPLTKLE